MVSNPIALQKLSLVDKQRQRNNNDSSKAENTTTSEDNEHEVTRPVSAVADETQSTPTHRTRPVVPITSPRKPAADPKPELPADDEHDDLLKLASKQREIFELEQKLKQRRQELKQMEEEIGRKLGLQSSSGGNQQDGLRSMLQKRLEEVNRSPNIIRTKKSVSNLLQRGNALLNDSQPITRENSIRENSAHDAAQTKLPPSQRPQQQQQQQQQSRPPPVQRRQAPRPPPRNNSNGSNRPQSSFFGRIVDKFHEMNREEADFDKHSYSSHKDKYYIGETYGYDDEIEDDNEQGEPLEHINDIPTSLFKR